MNTNIKKDIFLQNILGKDAFEIISLKGLRFKKNSFYYYKFDFDPKIIKDCEEKKFSFVGGLSVFKLKSSGRKKIIGDKPKVSHEDLSELYRVARTFVIESRFYNDLRLRKFSNTIMKTWVYNSFFNGYADDYCVVRNGGKVVGFCTIKIGHDVRIDLIGVDKKFQRKGIGSKMIKEIVRRYGFKDILVGTQTENIIAVNFYLKNGFSLFSQKIVFHKHT